MTQICCFFHVWTAQRRCGSSHLQSVIPCLCVNVGDAPSITAFHGHINPESGGARRAENMSHIKHNHQRSLKILCIITHSVHTHTHTHRLLLHHSIQGHMHTGSCIKLKEEDKYCIDEQFYCQNNFILFVCGIIFMLLLAPTCLYIIITVKSQVQKLYI